MLNEFIRRLIAKRSFNYEESMTLARLLLNANEAQIASVLTLMSAKGITLNELLGFHKVVADLVVLPSGLKQNHAPKMLFERTGKPFVDIVGSGGDQAHTLNISTASALLVASCGVPVIKHGSKAVSSSCGAADLLLGLGGGSFDIHDNFSFCLASEFYPFLATIAKVRRMLKTPTIFNLLGPLLNPYGNSHVLLGVYSPDYVHLMAQALQKLGTIKSLVFHCAGLDELYLTKSNINAKLVTPTDINDIVIDTHSIRQTLGDIQAISIADLRGGDLAYNVNMVQLALSTPIDFTQCATLEQCSDGDSSLAFTDAGSFANTRQWALYAFCATIALNAATALYLYGKAASITEGIALAKERLAQGDALKLNKLQQIIRRKYTLPKVSKSLKMALLTTKHITKRGGVISEIKRASPSVGDIATITDPAARACNYVACGASAISVLTDEAFKGSYDDLMQVAKALSNTQVPVLCKDFIINVRQIAYAKECGADAILLIASLVGNNTNFLVEVAHQFGLEVLLEVHNETELEIAFASAADIIGVNMRNLKDFTMHPETFTQLIKVIANYQAKEYNVCDINNSDNDNINDSESNKMILHAKSYRRAIIAESGINNANLAKEVLALGYDGLLVGEALSRLANAQDFFTELYS